MDYKTIEKLNELNKKFYEVNAGSFSDTRQISWPGWEQIFPSLVERVEEQDGLKILDIGCGNGRFAKFLNKMEVFKKSSNIQYIGIDSSKNLIDIAKKETKDIRNFQTTFLVADALDFDDLKKKIGDEKFDLIVAIGLMHHIPGFDNRIELLQNLSMLLRTNGQLWITFWQFLRSKRAKNWVLDSSFKDLEKNDYLLDWEGSGTPRYCHYFDDEEVDLSKNKMQKAGFEVIKDFNSDGKEGDLNRYLVIQN